MILEIEALTKKFSGVTALKNVSFGIEKMSVKALIGPNGAGKTTLLQIVSGILRATSGRILYQEKDITRIPTHKSCFLGISRTFQLIRLFPDMSVLENVMTGCHINLRTGVFMSGFHLPRLRAEEKMVRQESQSILEFMGIGDKADVLATSLPYGQQRLVEISRALASKPTLLMLDEPAAGMNAREKGIVAQKILQIRDSGVTILLIDHDMGMVMDISDEIVVLNFGQVIADGPTHAVQEDPKVIKAYLGMKNDYA